MSSGGRILRWRRESPVVNPVEPQHRRSGQGGGGRRGHWQRTVQRRKRASRAWGPDSPNFWKVKLDEHAGSSHMEVISDLDGNIFSILHIHFNSTFHLQHCDRTCIFKGNVQWRKLLSFSESRDQSPSSSEVLGKSLNKKGIHSSTGKMTRLDQIPKHRSWAPYVSKTH